MDEVQGILRTLTHPSKRIAAPYRQGKRLNLLTFEKFSQMPFQELTNAVNVMRRWVRDVRKASFVMVKLRYRCKLMKRIKKFMLLCRQRRDNSVQHMQRIWREKEDRRTWKLDKFDPVSNDFQPVWMVFKHRILPTAVKRNVLERVWQERKVAYYRARRTWLELLKAHSNNFMAAFEAARQKRLEFLKFSAKGPAWTFDSRVLFQVPNSSRAKWIAFAESAPAQGSGLVTLDNSDDALELSRAYAQEIMARMEKAAEEIQAAAAEKSAGKSSPGSVRRTFATRNSPYAGFFASPTQDPDEQVDDNEAKEQPLERQSQSKAKLSSLRSQSSLAQSFPPVDPLRSAPSELRRVDTARSISFLPSLVSSTQLTDEDRASPVPWAGPGSSSPSPSPSPSPATAPNPFVPIVGAGQRRAMVMASPETASIIRNASRGSLLSGVGDFKIIPPSLHYSGSRSNTPLRDTRLQLASRGGTGTHSRSSSPALSPSASLSPVPSALFFSPPAPSTPNVFPRRVKDLMYTEDGRRGSTTPNSRRGSLALVLGRSISELEEAFGGGAEGPSDLVVAGARPMTGAGLPRSESRVQLPARTLVVVEDSQQMRRQQSLAVLRQSLESSSRNRGASDSATGRVPTRRE